MSEEKKNENKDQNEEQKQDQLDDGWKIAGIINKDTPEEEIDAMIERMVADME